MASVPHSGVFGVVYLIENTVSHTVYIGQTAKSRPQERWKHHRYMLSRGDHANSHLQHAWIKYGADVFEFVILEMAISQEELDEIECFYIAYLRSIGVGIYNQKSGGGFGGKISAESRAKIGNAHRGRKLGTETRQRMSEATRGKKKPPQTADHRAKIGAASTINQADPEYREKRRQMALGLKRSPEAYIRMSEAQAKRFGVIYHLTSPDGTEHAVTNLSQFCQEHGLNKFSIKNLFNGPNRVKQYRGWVGWKEQNE